MREELSQIESQEFSARVNIASDFKMFLAAVGEEESVKSLFEILSTPENRLQLLSRTIDLANVHTDPRYEHPWDTPLAVYLWVLSLRDWKLARYAAVFVIDIPKTWYADRMSRLILLGEGQRSNAGSDERVLRFDSPRGLGLNQASYSGEAIFLGSLPGRDEPIRLLDHTILWRTETAEQQWPVESQQWLSISGFRVGVAELTNTSSSTSVGKALVA